MSVACSVLTCVLTCKVLRCVLTFPDGLNSVASVFDARRSLAAVSVALRSFDHFDCRRSLAVVSVALRRSSKCTGWHICLVNYVASVFKTCSNNTTTHDNVLQHVLLGHICLVNNVASVSGTCSTTTQQHNSHKSYKSSSVISAFSCCFC